MTTVLVVGFSGCVLLMKPKLTTSTIHQIACGKRQGELLIRRKGVNSMARLGGAPPAVITEICTDDERPLNLG